MTLYDQSRKPDEFFLITHFLSRRLAYPLALLFRRLGFSANAVSILGGLCWVASVPLIILAGWLLRSGPARWGWAALLGAALLWNAGYILDVADGSLARMTDSASASGFYLDFSFHLLFNTMYLASLGIFLYMLTCNPLYAVLAALSPCCNWGLSFAAKEHVLCEDIAKGRYRAGRLPPEEEGRIFIDSVKTKQTIGEKRGALRTLRHLAEELICFPGQFTLFGFVVLGDLALRRLLPRPLLLLKFAFVAVTGAMLLRVPFRLRREFRTLRRYDELTREQPPPAVGRGGAGGGRRSDDPRERW